MIIEYNVKYNNNNNKTYLQSKIYDLFAKNYQLLLLSLLLRLVKIIIVHSELIKRSSVDPYTLFQKNIDGLPTAGVFKNK
jgi:hypothetical protein